MLDIHKPIGKPIKSSKSESKYQSFVLSEPEEKTSSEYQELGYKLVKLVKLAHIDHVNTRKFSRHQALEEMYTQLPEVIDPYLEMVVNYYGDIPCHLDKDKEYDALYTSSEKLDYCLDMVYQDINALAKKVDGICLETALGDIQKFLVGIKYKLERF